MRPKVKYHVIYRHWDKYPISVMCKFFGVSRSGYYDFVKRLGQPEHDADLAEKILECQDKTDKTYGYRRVWKWLKARNIDRNPKSVLRVMKKYGLLSEIRRHRKWVNLGQQVYKYKNHLNRQFWADRPNSKWVTGISYIHTKEGVLYLSMIRDLYDNAMAENFFSILKTEYIYRHKPKTFHEANDLIDRYIHFYNHERIQNKTGVAPLTLRHSA